MSACTGTSSVREVKRGCDRPIVAGMGRMRQSIICIMSHPIHESLAVTLPSPLGGPSPGPRRGWGDDHRHIPGWHMACFSLDKWCKYLNLKKEGIWSFSFYLHAVRGALYCGDGCLHSEQLFVPFRTLFRRFPSGIELVNIMMSFLQVLSPSNHKKTTIMRSLLWNPISEKGPMPVSSRCEDGLVRPN